MLGLQFAQSPYVRQCSIEAWLPEYLQVGNVGKFKEAECDCERFHAHSRYASPPPSDGETQFWIHTQNTGCEKQIHSRISTDSQYLGAASMGVVLVEIIASFLAGYRAYNFAHPDDDQ
ncbi:hypothetical protein RB195_018843 [Necator americanus]|uniref:Uncharacterized protein n=1 Tax=Necator americanus TaxID=51031 RepID=A0ABR1CF47_NECAM